MTKYEKNKAWRSTPRGRALRAAEARHWRARHPEKYREIQRRWRAKNPEKVREIKQRYQAKLTAKAAEENERKMDLPLDQCPVWQKIVSGMAGKKG